MKTAHEFLTEKGGKRSYSALEVHEMLGEYADQFKPKWVSVEEEGSPSGDAGYFIIYCGDEYGAYIADCIEKYEPIDLNADPCMGAFWHKDIGFWNMDVNGEGLVTFDVTHWMPLPEPPKTV